MALNIEWAVMAEGLEGYAYSADILSQQLKRSYLDLLLSTQFCNRGRGWSSVIELTSYYKEVAMKRDERGNKKRTLARRT